MTSPRASTVVFATVLGLLGSLLIAGPAQAFVPARVAGVVTAPGGGVPDAPVRVRLSSTDPYATVATATTDPVTGEYSLEAAAGTYYLEFEYLGEANVLPRIFFDGSYPNGLIGVGQISLAEGENVVNR